MTAETVGKSVVNIEVVHDIACPWCYVGHAQLKRVLQQAQEASISVSISWSPFMLNPAMPEQGMPRRDYLVAKFGEAGLDRYKRVEDSARAEGLPMSLDRIAVQPNTLDAHMLVAAAGDQALQMVECLYEAFFCEGRDLTQRKQLLDVAEAAGMQRLYAAGALEDTLLRKRVRHEAEDWASRGIHGVPAFCFSSDVVKDVWLNGAVGSVALSQAIAEARGHV
ncbi:MAG: DsbA family oxidoreductase [Burkholderiaceae bacterium]|nr:DsbA family oxidoreductase [Burkholderiaceae bacterium]